MKSAIYEDISRQIANLIHKYIRLRALYTKELAKNYNLSVMQLLCLECLYENDRLSMSDIAENIMVNVSTVTGIVDRLEKKGFLERCRESGDRRVITIALTEKGRNLAENSPPLVHHKIIDAVKRLSETERAEISKALNTLSRLIETDEDDSQHKLTPAIQQAEDTMRQLREYT
jgi:DNA-binding MarR family transcriptional regulator